MRMLSKANLLMAVVFIVFVIANAYASNKNILIIGGSSGIGKALVKRYSESDYNVYTTFNNTIPERVPSNVSYIKVDLLDPESIKAISEYIKNIKFDLVIYNAGKFGYKSNRGLLDRQDWINSFVINSIAPIELAFALEDKFIEKGGKYVVITSRRGSNTINIQDEYEGRYSYRSSKSALNSALVALSKDFKEKGIAVLMLHPGQVKTEMTKYKGMEPEQSVEMIKNTIDLRSLNDTGKFIDVQNNSELPW
ncbi:MAG: SDR family NAD(P)-dependent oxidoreductase [Alphaproteobacteria bacterium]|nr:SDR family NAD(P)-dependent oxidoreductase [Alphaproteobacteria bacterium]